MGTLCRFVLLVVSLIATAVSARPLRPEEVPEPLKPWVGWVLTGSEDRICPFYFQDAEARRCQWPNALKLELDNGGGRFELTWRADREGWASLPGDAQHWPQEVGSDGEPVVVTERDGRPALWLPIGTHTLRGAFLWTQIPEALSVPADVGLLNLTVNSKPVAFPDLNADGRLWLKARDTGPRAAEETDRLELQVFRRVTDDMPLTVATHLVLDVAGSQREVALKGALLDEFIPLMLLTPLPARLDADGSLAMQVRPGRFEIDISARHPREVTALGLGEAPAPWPGNEIWAFEARNHLRLVEVEGLLQIDPQQTNLPADWRQFPAYRVNAGDSMRFKVIRRGDPQPEPDRLTLSRELWLDFDGGGATFNDQVGGAMTSGWRLEAHPPMRLGRVAVDGQPQLITRAPGSTKDGVEMRRGRVDLAADGRLEGGLRELPAAGWAHDFQQASATLHLPPGWRLLHVRGVDNKDATGAWAYKWTLLDLFLVLIAAVAAGRLWQWRAGVLVLATLALTWHEAEAPRTIWLHLLAAMALASVLPAGRLRSLAALYRNVALLVLAVIALPFMVEQVRIGLYPQLERPWQNVATAELRAASPAAAVAETPAPAAPMVAEEAAPMAEEKVQTETLSRLVKRRAEGVAGGYEAEYGAPASSAGRSVNFDEIDPKANVQTGPGLPRWRWTEVPLAWNGPVQSDQTVKLTLLSPRQNLALNLLRVVLIALLAALLARLGLSHTVTRKAAASAAVVLLTVAGLGAGGRHAEAAEFPSPELLNELKARLLSPPECLPACAEAARMRLSASAEALQLRLEIHARESVAVPLPGAAHHWLPATVSVDGEPAAGLARAAGGELWLQLAEGAHQVLIEGPLPPQATVELPLPLKPYRVEVERLDGWSLAGVREDGTVEDQLLLTRDKRETEAQTGVMEPAPLAPFARVERTLRLGLNWRVETQVVRASAADSAIVIEVPLLAGESVATAGVRVADGKAQVNLPAQESVFSYESVLEKSGEVTLTAPRTTAWTEVWRADVSPVLHMETSGIAAIHHQAAEGNWLPQWRPWPGESVKLTLTRPEGVEGRTFTLDASRLQLTPGERATDAALELALRSSQGGQYTLTLPEEAELLSASIDGTPQPIRQEKRLVTIPLAPGSRTLTLAWREPEGLRSRYATAVVDLAVPSVNASIEVSLPSDRWVLLTGGPRLGPAVMFWGVLLVIALVAAGLGRVRLTPLGTGQWLLLGVGLSQNAWGAVLVAGWLLALGWRAHWRAAVSKFRFNCVQIAVMLLTLIALGALFDAIKQGLLGVPDMQIAGNGSDAHHLRWYQDHTAASLPVARVLSVPLIAYHLLMLAWALWLAFALLKWLRWGWQCYTTNGYWRPFSLFKRKEVATGSGSGG